MEAEDLRLAQHATEGIRRQGAELALGCSNCVEATFVQGARVASDVMLVPGMAQREGASLGLQLA